MNWSTHYRMDPNARRNVMGSEDMRRHFQKIGHEAKAKLRRNIVNPAYKSRLFFETERDSRGQWHVWIGTFSSFAHWEEFGAINWHGPIAPMRRTMHAMGMRVKDYGP